MRNLKHTIIGIAAITMVGTLSFFQVSDMSAKKLERNMKLTTANQIENISITTTENVDGTVAMALTSTEEEVVAAEAEEPIDEATEQAIAEKSYLTLGYARVTGTKELKVTPSDTAESAGTISGADQVEILESTDGWYKVKVNDKSGYIKSDLITLDKDIAEEAAKQYDHYKRATVTEDSGLIVRKSGSTEAESLGTVLDGENVIIVDSQANYIKILYGNDYKEGYVVNTGLTTTGEWVEKNDVHTEIKRIAAEKAEKARQEAIAKQNAQKASLSYSTNNTASSQVKGSGQALVNTAMKYLGVPYVWGGTSPRGFDCSGLVQYVCRANGISVPRVAASQRNAGKYVSRQNLLPGDLVFFSNGGGISHVGIYVGNGKMIHAPQTGDVVKISSIETSYRVNRYAGAVRVW